MATSIYRDLFGAWRWEFTDDDGDIFDSPVRYDTREECVEAASSIGFDAARKTDEPHAHEVASSG